VSFIQEPGFKLRAVANPNRVHQLANEPLKKALWKALSRLPQDCTYDQMKGVHQVQDWLKAGLTVHCVDLSDATNNFPLSLQMECARRCLGESWEPNLEYFKYCAEGPWRVKDPELSAEREIRWSKGQPLGLGPSFGIFAYAHHQVVRYARTRAMRENPDSPANYVLLGDDIALVGDTLHQEYLQVLGGLGCPVSVSKCLSSDRAAEFAGKVITPDSIISPFKWKETSDRSFMDTARNLGPGSLQLFRKKQKEVIQAIAEIPEDFGGLGWNPKGKSFERRVDENIDTIKALERDDNLQPYRNQARLEIALQLELGLTHSVGILQSLQGGGEVASNSTDQVLEDLRSHKALVNRFSPEIELFGDDEDLIRGYTPVVRESDPRGQTTLTTYQRKLATIRKDDGFSR